MNFDWALLFDFLLTMLDRCEPEGTSDDWGRVAVRAARQPFRARLALTRGLRDQGLSGRDLRLSREIAWDMICDCPDEEIEACASAWRAPFPQPEHTT